MPPSPSNSYQLLPVSSFPSMPRFARKGRHPSFPRIPLLVLILFPLSIALYILYKLALISNAFRTYEVNSPVFSEPFRGTGEEVEGRADEFPAWVTSDKNNVEVTVWNIKTELATRLQNMGLPESSVSCQGILSGQRNSPTFLESRYSHLFPLEEGDQPSPYISEPQGFYFALNLFNSKGIIPHLFQTLLTVAALLGPSNVHISIFENGSWDETVPSMAHFARALTALGVAHSLRSDSHSTDWSNVDRIEQLALYRDVAISSLIHYNPSDPPLFDSARAHKDSPHPTLPTDLIFINDVFVCPADILELLHQRRFQGASATCGMDWRVAPEGSLWGWLDGWLGENYRFYDNWVTRTIEGWPTRPRVDIFAELRDGIRELFHWDSSTSSLNRFRAALPLPVYSCWNGMIVLNALPFLPSHIPSSDPTSSATTPIKGGHDIHFRHGRTDQGECAASECKLVARDFWGVGEKKWVMVPRVAVTYREEAYKAEGDRLEVWPFYTEGPGSNSTLRHNWNQSSSHIPWEDIF
ncbi:cryptococcal mannosyltransferase 1-domain-containing protein [Mrakia frigida]|uniref:glycosyltransferase family 69 protein n=1 Tax=Mrakia frigida TaxID=29902 RepID=UPI003FCC106B